MFTLRLADVHHCITFYVDIMHTTDKHIDKLAENGIIIIGFMKYSSFALYSDYPYVIFEGLRAKREYIEFWPICKKNSAFLWRPFVQ